MSTPEQTISEQVHAALKEGHRERTDTLRLLLNEIKNEQIRQREEVDETGFLKIVRRAIKQRQESASQYADGGRDELAAKEHREIEILQDYLPEEIDDEELRQAVAGFIESDQLSGPAAIGPLMKRMMNQFAGRVDGARINKLVREALSAD